MQVHARKRVGKGLDPATVKARRAMAAGFFGNLVALGDVPRNPFATVETPRLKQTVLRVSMSFDEAEAIIQQLPLMGWYGPRLRILLGLALHAGARIDEILKADWGDIDWTANLITFNGKGSKQRNVPLTPWLRAELADYRARYGTGAKGFAAAPIFIGRKGGRLAHKSVYAAIERFQLRSKYGIHPHLFRHLFATQLARKDTRLTDIKKALGHASAASSEKYIDAVAGDIAEAMANFASSSTLPLPGAQAPAPVAPTVSHSVAQGTSVQWRFVGTYPAAA